jgi:hypothetical protein
VIFEQRVRFAIDHPLALLDRRAAERIGEMAFAGPGWAQEEHVFTLLDEARVRQVEDERPVEVFG